MNLPGTCIIHSEYGKYRELSGSSKFNDFDENSRKNMENTYTFNYE